MSMSFKIVSIVALALVVSIAGFYAFNNYIYTEKQADPENPRIASFEECIEAGYTSLDSYPEQCVTPSGKRFVRNLPEDELDRVTIPVIKHGAFVCLPHWNTEGPQTMECAFGLKDGAGNFYALRDGEAATQSIGTVGTEAGVTVVGTFTPGSTERHQSVGVVEVSDFAIWQDGSVNGTSFSYPATLPTDYVHTVDWPPQLRIINEPYSCTAAGTSTERAGGTEEHVVNEKKYCVTTVTEAAAGSVYHQYAYTTALGGQTLTVTFSTRYPRCENYDAQEQTDCENEQESFNSHALVDQIVRSINALQP